VSGENCTPSVAPAADTAFTVTWSPVNGSAKVLPSPSGASEKLVVAGVASRSCDWTIVVGFGAIRMVTPVTAGSDGEKLSKIPVGCRNSNWKYVPSLRAMRSSLGEPPLSAGTSR
jgi:hypothetical protein